MGATGLFAVVDVTTNKIVGTYETEKAARAKADARPTDWLVAHRSHLPSLGVKG